MPLTNYEKHVGQNWFHREAIFQAIFYIAKGTLLVQFSRKIGFSVLQISLLSTVYTIGGVASVFASYFYERSRSSKRFMVASYAASLGLFFSAILVGLSKAGSPTPTGNWIVLGLILLSTLAHCFYQAPADLFALTKPCIQGKHDQGQRAAEIFSRNYHFLELSLSQQDDNYLWHEFIIGVCALNKLMTYLRPM